MKKYVLPTISKRDDFLICNKCGNYKKFTRTNYLAVRATETEIFIHNNDGTTITDFTDYDEGDLDRTDSDDWDCPVCNTQDVTDYGDDSEEQIYKFILKHIDKKGHWSEDEVEEINKTYEKQVIARRI